MKHIYWILFYLLLLIFPKTVFATISVSLSSVPSSINVDQEFTASLDLVCSECGTSYLRGVFFYPESSNTYSGFTQNNSGNWVNVPGSQSTDYFKIEDGSWSGQLKFKFDSTKTAGNYFFKVGRYTSSGNSFAQTSDKVDISVISPTPEPTPTSTPTSVTTPSPTATNIRHQPQQKHQLRL